jgi:hypothetical protein
MSSSRLDGTSSLNTEGTISLSIISVERVSVILPAPADTSTLNTKDVVQLRQYLSGRQTGIDLYR